MRRREFITLIGGAAAAWPLAARAQQGDRMWRIGVIVPAAANDARIGIFQQGLQDRAGLSGDVHLDIRWTTPNATKIRQQAAELVALAPDNVARIDCAVAQGRRSRSAARRSFAAQ